MADTAPDTATPPDTPAPKEEEKPKTFAELIKEIKAKFEVKLAEERKRYEDAEVRHAKEIKEILIDGTSPKFEGNGDPADGVAAHLKQRFKNI